MGMRACAELAGQGRARRDDSATQGALAAAGELVAWVERTGGAPFADHPYVATIPAARASWDAERSRLSEAGDPRAWQAAADAWTALGCPHRAGYAEWRHAEARLLAGEPPTAVADTIRSAAAAAAGHVPLLAAIRALADRARIPLDAPSTPAEPHSEAAPYGLTDRELLVLRLVAAGRSNRGDRRRAVHQPEDGQRPREQHPAQARRVHPRPGRRPRRTRRHPRQAIAVDREPSTRPAIYCRAPTEPTMTSSRTSKRVS